MVNQGVDIRIDASEFRAAERVMHQEAERMRLEIDAVVNEAGDTLARRIRAGVRAVPSTGGDGLGVRAAIAAAVTVNHDHGTGFGPLGRVTKVNVSIDESKIPDGHRAVVRAFNRRMWSHPVFGGSATVTQRGHPYLQVNVETVRAATTAALERMAVAEAHDIDRRI